MTVSETLNETWSAVLTEASQAEGMYHRRIPLTLHWPAHAGIHRPTEARLLILETDRTVLRGIRFQDETKGYSVDIGPDEAGRVDRAWIRIQETSQAYREIFTIFCADILEHWRLHASASDAVESLRRRLSRWKKFFQRGAQAGLNREDYVGLYGELSFIEAGLNVGLAVLGLISAWQAPLAANQDFLFGPVAVEVKTTTANEIDRVRITNVRQLDSTGLQSLFLARYAFDFRQGSGRTLPQLVAVLKDAFSIASLDALSVFRDRLLEAGFVEGVTNELDDWGFTLRELSLFRVSDDFPRLIESALPSGVSEVSYMLNLSVAMRFQMTASNFWSTISSSHG